MSAIVPANNSFTQTHSNVPYGLRAIVECPNSTLIQADFKEYMEGKNNLTIRQDITNFLKETGKSVNDLFAIVESSFYNGVEANRFENIVRQMKNEQDATLQFKNIIIHQQADMHKQEKAISILKNALHNTGQALETVIEDYQKLLSVVKELKNSSIELKTEADSAQKIIKELKQSSEKQSAELEDIKLMQNRNLAENKAYQKLYDDMALYSAHLLDKPVGIGIGVFITPAMPYFGVPMVLLTAASIPGSLINAYQTISKDLKNINDVKINNQKIIAKF